MKLNRLALLAVFALLAAACESTTPQASAEGAYVLAEIDGTSVDGLPVRVVGGTMTLREGVYDSEFTYSIGPSEDRGTIRDHGRYKDDGTRVILTSEWHFTAGPGRGTPRSDTATVAGDALTVGAAPGWVYHWRRDE